MNHTLKNIKNLLICKFVPIKKRRLVFTSFSGHYSDSPKYISEKIHELDDSIELVWLVRPEVGREVPDYVKKIPINSKEAQKYRGSAEAVINNVYCERAFTLMSDSLLNKIKKIVFCFLNDKKKQVALTTFHGTPLKRIGRDQLGNHIVDFICPHTVMALGNQYSAEIMSHVTFRKIQMELLGSPRNDILFHHSEAVRLKEKLGLPTKKKILLFAPTFRNDGPDVEGKNIQRSGLNQIQEMDLDRMLQELRQKFGGDWAMVCRFHYHVDALIDWEDLRYRFEGKIINGNMHDDMAEYLACSDILLTDSSSSMFDFMLTKKPCFLYFPDYENYKEKERGFYLPIESLPFPMAQTFEKLIENISGFDDVGYAKEVEVLIEKFGYVDDGNASERIAKYVLERLKNGD